MRAEPDNVLLLGPGPSPVAPSVLKSMGWNVLGHLDPEFLALMNDTMDLLRYVFETRNPVTLPISGTGSAGMEAAFVNFVEPGDKVIVGVNGVFGSRMADVASRCGAQVVTVGAEWGQPIDPAAVERALSQNPDSTLVAVVHAETSTGVLQPVEPIIEAAHRAGAMIFLDAVTSLGGVPVSVDARGLDVVYSGTQKCLSCPPGLAPLTVGERALERLRARKHPVQSWYLDLSMITQYWGKERFYHHTAPVSMIYGLYTALHLIKQEGLDVRFRRHRINAKALVTGLEALGLRLLPEEEYRLPSLTAVYIPDGIPDLEVRGTLRGRYGIEIGGGLGPLKGRLWRIGLMGYGSNLENVERLLKALGDTLSSVGYRCSAKEAVSAARERHESLEGSEDR